MKIRKAIDFLTLETFVVCICGASGAGKSSIAFSGNNVLHLDFDERAQNAVQRNRPDSAQFNDYEDFLKSVFSKEFEALIEEEGYQTIVIDTLDALIEDFCTPYIIAQDANNGNSKGGLSQSGWGVLANEICYKIFPRFKKLGLNVVYVCHTKDMEGTKREMKTVLDIPGKSNQNILRKTDLIGFVEIRGKNRYLDFNPKQNGVGKSFLGDGEASIFKVPSQNEDAYVGFFETILAKARAKMMQKTEAQLAAEVDLSAILKAIDDCITIEQLGATQRKGATQMQKIKIQETYNKKFVSLYKELKFKNIETVESANDALVQIKKDCTERELQIALFECLKNSVSFIYNSQNKKFEQNG